MSDMAAKKMASDPLHSVFTFAKMRKNWSVFPLVGIMTVAVCGATGFATYSAATKSDVNFKHGKGMAPRHERLDPETYRFKILKTRERHQPHPQRDQLLKEIGSYKY